MSRGDMRTVMANLDMSDRRRRLGSIGGRRRGGRGGGGIGGRSFIEE